MTMTMTMSRLGKKCDSFLLIEDTTKTEKALPDLFQPTSDLGSDESLLSMEDWPEVDWFRKALLLCGVYMDQLDSGPGTNNPWAEYRFMSTP